MFRIKIFKAVTDCDAYSMKSNNLTLVNKWADNAKRHYPNNTVTIQHKEKGIWQDWCLV